MEPAAVVTIVDDEEEHLGCVVLFLCSLLESVDVARVLAIATVDLSNGVSVLDAQRCRCVGNERQETDFENSAWLD